MLVLLKLVELMRVRTLFGVIMFKVEIFELIIWISFKFGKFPCVEKFSDCIKEKIITLIYKATSFETFEF
jgi:hypothetical protein